MTRERWVRLAELLSDAMASEQSPTWAMPCFSQSLSVIEALLAAGADQATLFEPSANEPE